MDKILIKEFKKELKEKGVSFTESECRLVAKAYETSLINAIGQGRTVTIESLGTFNSTLQAFRKSFTDKERTVEKFRVRFRPSVYLKGLLNGKASKKEQ